MRQRSQKRKMEMSEEMEEKTDNKKGKNEEMEKR